MSKALDQYLNKQLQALKQNGTYNEIQTVQGPNDATIIMNGKKLINLSSNNYLGLATDPRLKKAAQHAIERYGVGAGAVRSINGTLEIHTELEKVLSLFKGTEAAIAYQSGFNCNMAAISAVMDQQDVIFSDELNHASIIDGCRLAKATIIRYQHSDMDDLREKVKNVSVKEKYKKKMIITDGVFSMDGDIAKLPEIVEIAKEFDCIVYVDDAHGSGVTGNGYGTVKHFGLEKEIHFQIGTLSKAVGVVGGYVAGKASLIEWLKVRSRPFLFSTALSPADTAASVKALEIITESPTLTQKLWENGDYLKQGLKKLGFEIGNSETPITPCMIGEEKTTQQFSKRLVEEGVYAKAIVYPTVPKGKARIRNMPTAVHSKSMLDQALSIYEKIGKEMGLI